MLTDNALSDIMMVSGGNEEIAGNATFYCKLSRGRERLQKEVCDMYDMMTSASASRMPACFMQLQGLSKNVRGRSAMAAIDPVSLASSPRRASVRRTGGSNRICGVRTAGERRCAFR